MDAKISMCFRLGVTWSISGRVWMC